MEGRRVGRIGRGLLVLVGFGREDAPPEGSRDPDAAGLSGGSDGSGGGAVEERLVWMAEKLWGLRVFADEEGRMNRSTEDVGGSLLLVSQFTLYGDVSRGRRPSFVEAAAPEIAERLYDRFVEVCRARGGPVETGEFGALMEVELVNDGPVTLIVER